MPQSDPSNLDRPRLDEPQTTIDLYNAYNDYLGKTAEADELYYANIINQYPNEKARVLQILQQNLSLVVLKNLSPEIPVDYYFSMALHYGMQNLAQGFVVRPELLTSLNKFAYRTFIKFGYKLTAYNFFQGAFPEKPYLWPISLGIFLIGKANIPLKKEMLHTWATLLNISESSIDRNFLVEEQTASIQQAKEDPLKFFNNFTKLQSSEVTPEFEQLAFAIFTELLNSQDYEKLSLIDITKYVNHLIEINPTLAEYLLTEVLVNMWENLANLEEEDSYYLEWVIRELSVSFIPLIIEEPHLIERFNIIIEPIAKMFPNLYFEIFWRLGLQDGITRNTINVLFPQLWNAINQDVLGVILCFQNDLNEFEKRDILINPYFREFLKNLIALGLFKVNDDDTGLIINTKIQPIPFILDILRDITQAEANQSV